jgi:arabinan endo-1,5-alpha-L-arabinosidase
VFCFPVVCRFEDEEVAQLHPDVSAILRFPLFSIAARSDLAPRCQNAISDRATSLVLRAGIALLVLGLTAEASIAQNLTGNLSTHDPSTVMYENGKYYFYYTGNGVLSKTSTDRINWSNGPAVFSNAPSWIASAVPGNDGNYWAPDVAYFNGLYHLYYSVSTFGSQDSAIGLATSPTLNPGGRGYGWTDQGPVIQSNPGQAPYNTIDPGIIQTSSGELWMSFGSFWNGIYITQLDPSTGLRITPNSPTTSIARNEDLTPDAIEASFIYEKDDYFYLFVNWGNCCQGVNSTYNIRVGRSANVSGPYFDQNGVNMVSGGGTPFLATEGNFIGPGHVSIFTDQGVEWFGYHYYSGTANGASRFNLRTIEWTEDGWPVAGPNYAPGDANLDGLVNLTDFDLISDNLFESATSRGAGDLNADGFVDYNDFRIWKNNYENIVGTGSGSGGIVPEPPIASVFVALIAIPAAYRRR